MFLREASAPVITCMWAKLNGHMGSFVEAHALDETTAWKVPKKMRGPVLSHQEVTELLDRLG